MDPSLDDIVHRWVTDHVGDVVSFERQHRWRPAWFVVARRGDQSVRLYVRGDRDGFGLMAVSHEAEILRVLHAESIPVPRIHGVIDGGRAVVMDWLPGEPDLSSAADEREVDAVMDAYIDALVSVHHIDPTRFESVGMTVPSTPETIALDYFEGFVSRYREYKRRPEPVLEFAVGWLRRHVPQRCASPRFVLGDSGQFMHADRTISGIIDVELAHIGDVAHDLGGLRLRNATEPMGDLGRVLRRYEHVSGEPLDLDAIEFHTAKFALCTPLGLVIALHLDLAIPEILQYIEWFHQLSLHAIESIARQADVVLDEVALPEPASLDYAGVVTGLPSMIGALDVVDGVAAYQRDVVATVARFAARANEFCGGIAAADFDDIEALLGVRPADRASGDALLEQFIADAGPEHDAALIRLLHRRVMRQMLLLEPVMAAPGGIAHLAALPNLLAR